MKPDTNTRQPTTVFNGIITKRIQVQDEPSYQSFEHNGGEGEEIADGEYKHEDQTPGECIYIKEK